MTRLALALCAVTALHAPRASAQSASETAAARGLFEQGLAAATEHDWPQALALFERSYALAPRASTLLNIAGAQSESGQLVQASESYRRVVAEAGATQRDVRIREQAQTALGQLLPRLARVTLRIADLGASDSLTVDDVEVARAIVGTAMPLNPGAHVVVVQRSGGEIGRARFDLAEGQSSDVTVVLRAAGAPIAAAAVTVADGDEELSSSAVAADPPPPGEDLAASPWLWTVVGVVVVGGVVAIVLATTLDTSPHYYSGNLGNGQVRF